MKERRCFIGACALVALAGCSYPDFHYAKKGGGGGSPPQGCGENVVIGEFRTRGVNGASDEFIELWNPTDADVQLDATWTIQGRSDHGTSFSPRWNGKGDVIRAGGYFLLGGTSYGQAPAPDDELVESITDSAALALEHDLSGVDEVCYYFDSATEKAFSSPSFHCPTPLVDNQPHDDSSSPASDSNHSLARSIEGDCGPVGAFENISPATPKSSKSPSP